MTAVTRKADAPRCFVIEVPGRPVSLNAERGQHWAARSKEVKQRREDAFWLAKEAKIPRLERVLIVGTPVYPDRRRRDPGNAYPTVKAIVDGLRDAGVIEDDSDRYVAGIVMRPAEVRPGTPGAMRIEIEEVPT